MSKQKKEIMLLLGAGVSTSCNIPTGVTLVNKIADKMGKPALKQYYLEIKQHYKRHGQVPDFEEVLVFLDMMEQRETLIVQSMYDGFIPKNVKKPDIKNLSKRLKKQFLTELRKLCMDFNLNKARKQYEAFLKLGDNLQLQIFTTNYDHIIEAVLDELEIDHYSTNFNKEGKGKRPVYFWDESGESLDEANIQIAKLHGSVTWYKDRRTKKIEEITTLTPISSARNPVDTIMITPTVFKDVYRKPYYILYDRFQSTLKKSKLLIVVGHSLRDEWLYGAIEDFISKGGYVVYIGIDPQNKLSNRIKVLNKAETFIYYQFMALAFFPQLAKIVKETQFDIAKTIARIKELSENKRKTQVNRKRTAKKNKTALEARESISTQ